ncbi:hypothetical protein G9464_17240 [Halostella sp. JP-L12]|uniref:hypothetical protein n=1 Tax=Halostella TaxID=1843185 RepID=UPI000EF8162F|nr:MULTISPECIES: hypothetical protein [Halostella]NHN49319.1 hypothetical protein [Halostella sp. JP-L12]
MARETVVRELKNADPREHVSAILAYVDGTLHEQHLTYTDWARMLTATEGRVGIQFVDVEDGDYRSWIVRYGPADRDGLLEAHAIHKEKRGTVDPTTFDTLLDRFHAEPIALEHDPLFETDGDELSIGDSWLTGTGSEEVAD